MIQSNNQFLQVLTRFSSVSDLRTMSWFLSDNSTFKFGREGRGRAHTPSGGVGVG